MGSRKLIKGQTLSFPLPAELLAGISSLLDASDLSSMARVSRQHRDFFQPILFENILIQYKSGSPTLETYRATLLLRTMLRRPDLALACESLRIDMWCIMDSKSENPPPSLFSEQDLDAAQRLILQIRPLALDPWRAGLQASDTSAAIALVLCCVTRIKKLHLTVDTLKKYDFINYLLIDLASSKQHHYIFEELREVIYHRQVDFRTTYHANYSYTPNTGECWAFFKLDQLSSLNISMYETHPDLQQAQMHYWGNNLRSLVLGRESCITGQTLGQILQATPHLESLVYDFHYECENGSLLKHFKSDEVGHALQQVKSTLRHLHISSKFSDYLGDDQYFNNVDYSFGFRGRLGSLADFAVLETLEVPLVVILGWKPTSNICLRDYLPLSLLHFICRNESVVWSDWSWDPHWSGYPKKGDEFPHQTFRQLSTLFDKSEAGMRLQQLTLYIVNVPERDYPWPAWPWTGAMLAALQGIAGDTKVSIHKCKLKDCNGDMCGRWRTYTSELDEWASQEQVALEAPEN